VAPVQASPILDAPRRDTESEPSPKPYTSGKIDWFRLDDLKLSEKAVGQIHPVIRDAKGRIIDGFHRKRANSDWKEVTVPIQDDLESLRLRIHLNLLRRSIPEEEKRGWVSEARRLLQGRGLKGTQEEIAKALGLTQRWVSKYDPQPIQAQNHVKVERRCTFYGYNVWGFRDESWRKLIVERDPDQPDWEFYHGATPAFVIHQLIQMFQPKAVLDSMAGVGTTKYVCDQYPHIVKKCVQFDIYPFPKGDVEEGDAECIRPDGTFDLIFNHIPYWNMVRYGDNPQDLSTMNWSDFHAKMDRIFKHNRSLLNSEGIYAILVGDWRHEGQLQPLTAKTTLQGLANGFVLQDAAIKLTGEMKSKSLQEYRAAKFGYLAQTYDTVLIFRKT
jgi:hypothetical protein